MSKEEAIMSSQIEKMGGCHLYNNRFYFRSEDRLLTKEEVAQQLGIGLTSVYNLTKSGKLTAVKVNRATRYRQSEVSDLLNAKCNRR